MARHAPTVDRIPGRTFLIVARDGEGSSGPRDRELEGHLEYIERHCDRYLTCGPMNNPGDPTLVGSFFLVSAEDEADARDLVNGDPYMTSGMYASVTVHEVTSAAGRWMGGVIWESADSVRARAS